MKRYTAFAALGATACLVFACAAPADAAIRIATYTGTVASGFDDTGMFGSVGALSGNAFTAVYTYDDTLGTRQTLANSDSVSGSGTGNPLLAATLTINGITVDFLDSQSNGGAYVSSDPGYVTDNTQTDQFAGFVEQTRQFDLHGTGALPASLDAAFAGAITGGGNFQYQDFFHSPFGFGSGEDAGATGTLSATFLTIDGPGGIPEPATWGLMILGFGFAGAALRRRSGQSDFHPLAKTAD